MKAQSKMTSVLRAVLLSLVLSGVAWAQGVVQVDPAIPSYQKVSGVSGSLSSVGSDTLNNLMTLWAEGFKKTYPNVNIQIEGKGSSTAPPALIEGMAQLGPMSRPMKGTEVDAFEKKYDYKPTPLRTSLDSLAVFVHKDNPIKGMTLKQVDAMFSRNRSCGSTSDIKVWGGVGLDGNWANAPVSFYGRNSASGTYGFFKEHALCKGDYKNTVKEQPGSASVVQGVGVDRYGIGYSGIGYATSGVRAVPLAESGGDFYGATYENVVSGDYPLSRFLYVYINKASHKPLDPLVREFARYIFSQEGQGIVVKDGYYPLPASLVEEELAKLE
jgi:phosphate transport system substrate-binding protein